ncbi:MAG: hypothetical protein WC052_02505 [Patescibacteria group bacterium]
MATPEIKREYTATPEQEFSETAPQTIPRTAVPDSAEPVARAVPQPVLVPIVSPLQSAPKSQTLQEIETIMAEDLAGIYASLDAPTRSALRVSGEQAALKISILLQSASSQLIKIIKIIRDWLRTIPGISWAFIEQETKVKTGKLLRLTDKHDRYE